MKNWIMRTLLATSIASQAAMVQAIEITVGQVGPMSGPDATQGHAFGEGMELAFRQVNHAGGVNGHRFTLVRKDDGGRPEETLTLTKQLLAESKPLVLAGYFGNRNVGDVVGSGLLREERIALVGYRSWQIAPETPYVYGLHAGLREELGKITNHLATIGISRLGLVYEDGPGAPALLLLAEDAATKANAKFVVRAPYQAGTSKVSPAVDQILKSTPPQAILLIATASAAAAFIDQYRNAGGTAQIFANSGADIEQLSKRLADEQMRGLAIAQVTPNPYKIASKVAKELNDLIASKSDKAGARLSYTMMEGFIAGKVIVEAVRRQGRAPTREGMVSALDSLNGFDVGGYVVSFKPDMHTGSRFVDLTIVSDTGKIRQ